METCNLLAMRGEKEVFHPLATALHFCSREEGRALLVEALGLLLLDLEKKNLSLSDLTKIDDRICRLSAVGPSFKK